MNGDWSIWSIQLDPHNESGNSTIFARLFVDEEHISPIDARRVILIDEMTESRGEGDGDRTILFAIGLVLIITIPLVGIGLYIRSDSFRSSSDDVD